MTAETIPFHHNPTQIPPNQLEDKMTDIVERAKAALEGVTEGPWGFDPETEYLTTPDGENVPSYIQANADFIAQSRSLVPELVAEIERLRANEWDPAWGSPYGVMGDV